MAKITRALLSVYDKTGLIPLAETLVRAGVELLSTGGTAQALRQSALPVTELSAFTSYPELFDGRVKTLHPKVHGGLLYLRGDPAHEAAAEANGIKPIDLVVVNLYPFEKTIAQAGATLPEAVEQIDIGGPALLRSAAKNHEAVTVVIDPADYAVVAAQIQECGATTLPLRRKLATRVFARTSAYDAVIAAHLIKAFAGAPESAERPAAAAETETRLFELPSQLRLEVALAQPLRYGENPHQKAALYGRFHDFFRQLQGKELSYNNILDLTAAAALIADFALEQPTLAILKHNNPCGVGQGPTLSEAWEKAYATDPQAPFGGVIAVNQPLDAACAEVIAELFSEVIVAPDFAPEALEQLQRKKNLRLLRMLQSPLNASLREIRSVGADSYLVQERDVRRVGVPDLKIVTRRQPTAVEFQAMLFGWRVVKNVKSNAIVYAAAGRTLGIGAGQMSRVDASRIAVWKAGQAGLSLQGSAVCSDAFFPFPDGLVAAAQAGATAAIQPGGSVRDAEVIAAADEHGLAMAFTGVRHFRH